MGSQFHQKQIQHFVFLLQLNFVFQLLKIHQ